MPPYTIGRRRSVAVSCVECQWLRSLEEREGRKLHVPFRPWRPLWCVAVPAYREHCASCSSTHFLFLCYPTAASLSYTEYSVTGSPKETSNHHCLSAFILYEEMKLCKCNVICGSQFWPLETVIFIMIYRIIRILFGSKFWCKNIKFFGKRNILM